jgi:regulation of enolase protein 1 (concanavalin A-like superfamily)
MQNMQWYNEPAQWSDDGGTISITTDAKTDYWRKTHYGFIRDNGHFYYQAVTGNFLAQVKLIGQYRDLYDQGGLMVRVDETTWIKCGIEYVEGVQQASAVVTRDFSDWSVSPLSQNPSSIWLRVKGELPAVEVSYSLDGHNFTLLRLAYLAEVAQVQVGVMACSPDGTGFDITFGEFSIQPLDE